jgi:hypothetical protein
LTEFDVDLGQFCPGYEFTRGAVDSLLCEANGPFMFTFLTEKVALDVEESKGLGRIPNSLRENLDGLDFLVCSIILDESLVMNSALTHSNVTLCQQSGDFWCANHELFEEIRRMSHSITITEVFHDPCRQVVRNETSDLNFWI